jgi:hypothetical protein
LIIHAIFIVNFYIHGGESQLEIYEVSKGIAYNVDGFAQADQIKTTRRPSGTKIQFYFSEASTQRLAQNRMLGVVRQILLQDTIFQIGF